MVSTHDVSTDEERRPRPSSPASILSQVPGGRAHAGEVTRRTDRRTSALPPPEPSRSGETSPNATSSRSTRQAKAPGGYDGDSDSEDDDKRRRKPHGEDDITPRRRGKRPEQTSSHNVRESPSDMRPLIDEEEELRQHIYMRKTLKFLGERRCPTISHSDRTHQEKQALDKIDPGERPGAVKSEIHEIMLEYVDSLQGARFGNRLAAFMRQNEPSHDNNTSTCGMGHNWIKNTLKAGGVRYEFMEVNESLPQYILELFGPHLQYLWPPIVFRVLVKDNQPMHAEPVSPSTLLNSGWNSNGRYWWRYERGSTKFTQSNVYRVRMTGQVDSAWSSSHRDDDFAKFMNKRQAERKQKPEVEPAFRSRMGDITDQLAAVST